MGSLWGWGVCMGLGGSLWGRGFLWGLCSIGGSLWGWGGPCGLSVGLGGVPVGQGVLEGSLWDRAPHKVPMGPGAPHGVPVGPGCPQRPRTPCGTGDLSQDPPLPPPQGSPRFPRRRHGAAPALRPVPRHGGPPGAAGAGPGAERGAGGQRRRLQGAAAGATGSLRLRHRRPWQLLGQRQLRVAGGR